MSSSTDILGLFFGEETSNADKFDNDFSDTEYDSTIQKEPKTLKSTSANASQGQPDHKVNNKYESGSPAESPIGFETASTQNGDNEDDGINWASFSVSSSENRQDTVSDVTPPACDKAPSEFASCKDIRKEGASVDRQSALPETAPDPPDQQTPKKWTSPWELTEKDFQSFRLWGCSSGNQLSSEKRKKAAATEKFKRQAKSLRGIRYRLTSPLAFLTKIIKSAGGTIEGLETLAETVGFPMYFPCTQCEYGNSMYDDYPTSYESTCKSCGRHLISMKSALQGLQQFCNFVEGKGLETFDVYPDGNCQFAALVDQLKTKGEFTYTEDTLRQAVVDYLRENPTSNDGTPYSQFLVNEKWEDYLERMSSDGQWGDHMTLSAMANLLKKKIVIYGGVTGKNTTTILPKDIKADSLEKCDCLYLGHLQEMHYISLRPKHWLELETQQSPNMKAKDNFPIGHMDFMLNQVFEGDFLSTYSHLQFPDTTMASMKGRVVGSLVCGMRPTIDEKWRTRDSESRMGDSYKSFLALFTPTDSAVSCCSMAGPMDLLPDRPMTNTFKLIPVRPKRWQGQTVEVGNAHYLKWVPSSFSVPMKQMIGFSVQWPDCARKWMEKAHSFLSAETLKRIKSNGCHAIPAESSFSDILMEYIPQDLTESKDIWSLSFALAEKEICLNITESQRQCFLMYKCLADQILGQHRNLPNAIITHVFFNACEYIQKENWLQYPAQCVLILFKQLAEAFQHGFLPHYFIESKNLLQNVPEEVIEYTARKLAVWYTNPIALLYHGLEILGITATEIGLLIDSVIKDLSEFAEHGDIQRSFVESIDPACRKVVQMFIENSKYSKAFSLLQAFHEKQTSLLNNNQSFLTTVMVFTASVCLCHKWCFALFMDISLGTKMSKNVCEAIPSLHISEVFGPDAQEMLVDTLIPEVASVNLGNVSYAENLGNMLKELGNDSAVISCLKFYLQNYISGAGDAILLPFLDEEAIDELRQVYVTRQGKTNEDVGRTDYSEALQRSSSLMYMLHNVHIHLFNACQRNNRKDEYVEFIPHLKAIVESCSYPFFTRNLNAVMQCIEGTVPGKEDITKLLAIIF